MMTIKAIRVDKVINMVYFSDNLTRKFPILTYIQSKFKFPIEWLLSLVYSIFTKLNWCIGLTDWLNKF